MQRIRYSRRSKYLHVFEQWVRAGTCAITAGDKLSTVVEPRTAFVRQQAQIEIMRDDSEFFETDWPYAKATFLSRLKALARAIRNHELYGRYQLLQHAGKMEMRKIDRDRLSPRKTPSDWKSHRQRGNDARTDHGSGQMR